MHQKIVEQEEKLQRLFSQAKNMQDIDEVDDEAKSAFVSYLCLRTSGYLETSIMTIVREYAEDSTRQEFPHIATFVRNKLNFTFNPWPSEILKLLGQFNVEWKDCVRDEIRDQISDPVEALVRNRNKIAHGEDVNLSLMDMKTAFNHAIALVELVYAQCNPPDS